MIEFGLRRAQGPDGALSASRASYVGGCAATSNVLAGAVYGIPVGGTHAHSLVMVFDTELEAFHGIRRGDAQQRGAPCGHVRHARGRRARHPKRGGVCASWGATSSASASTRATSRGSRSARGELLDEAGFGDAKVYASNELDEYTIESLKEQGAAIDVWGVGTKMVDRLRPARARRRVQALGRTRAGRGVGAARQGLRADRQGDHARAAAGAALRRRRPVGFAGDMIYDELVPPAEPCMMVDPADATRRTVVLRKDERPRSCWCRSSRRGRLVYEVPSLPESRSRAIEQLGRLDADPSAAAQSARLQGGYRTRAARAQDARSSWRPGASTRRKEATVRALLLVDIQNDFVPGGALAVPDGDAVVAVANALCPALQPRGGHAGLAPGRPRQLRLGARGRSTRRRGRPRRRRAGALAGPLRAELARRVVPLGLDVAGHRPRGAQGHGSGNRQLQHVLRQRASQGHRARQRSSSSAAPRSSWCSVWPPTTA